MKSYPTQELLKELFNYIDGVLVWKVRRSNCVNIGDVAGNISKSTGYCYISVAKKLYFAHRLIFIWHHGYNPENGIDHIDRDKLNNRIDNLREATQSCNVRNSGNRNDNVSGVKGIGWNKNRNKWRARISVMGKQFFLGFHDDFNEAVLHRLSAEQCFNWSSCDSSSPAYEYAINNNLIRIKL